MAAVEVTTVEGWAETVIGLDATTGFGLSDGMLAD